MQPKVRTFAFEETPFL